MVSANKYYNSGEIRVIRNGFEFVDLGTQDWSYDNSIEILVEGYGNSRRSDWPGTTSDADRDGSIAKG